MDVAVSEGRVDRALVLGIRYAVGAHVADDILWVAGELAWPVARIRSAAVDEGSPLIGSRP